MSRELPRGADTHLAQGPGGEDRGDYGRPLSAWLILALIFIVALVAAHSIETLNDYVGARSDSRVLLRAVEDDAAEQQLSEY